MLQNQASDIEHATTAISSRAPDAKTRRYDRQLRLWAATGQAALENARILVLGGSATSTSTLKNLVLPGVGHFTILDPSTVSPADAGNNFFLEGHESIGKSRAEEAARLLLELNEGVEGRADKRSLKEVLSSEEGQRWIKGFTVVVAHNAGKKEVEELAQILWEDEASPPLVVIRSAGFIAEFFIQYHKHEVIETHSDEKGSLRIDRPFPALAQWAAELDLKNMDTTTHSHIPYVVLLVRALEDWKKAHNGEPPKTTPDKDAFKKQVYDMRVKPDEENVDEAYKSAFRAYPFTQIPFEIKDLLSSSHLPSVGPDSPVFDRLLAALKAFVDKNGVLPLSAALPDMHSDTENYIKLQRMYKDRANEEKAEFKGYIKGVVDDVLVDAFVKNAHALRVLEGQKFGALDGNKDVVTNAIMGATYSRDPVTHFCLSAFFNVLAASYQGQTDPKPTAQEIQTELKRIIGDAELPEKETGDCIGELVRTPTAELPNVAAFLGGLVAQEVIKVVTKQYVPINGYCVVDLVSTFTGIVR